MTTKIDARGIPSPSSDEPIDATAAAVRTGGDERNLVLAPSAGEVVEIEGRRNDHVMPAIVIDLGKKKRKHLKQLKRGAGPLYEEVERVIDQVRAELQGELADKTLVPLVLIYRKKPGRTRATASFFPRS